MPVKYRYGSVDDVNWVRCDSEARFCAHRYHKFKGIDYVMRSFPMPRETPTKARFNFPLTLQQFRREKRAQIDTFEKEWHEAHSTDAKSFPLEMSFEDWEKEFLIHSQPETSTNERKR